MKTIGEFIAYFVSGAVKFLAGLIYVIMLLAWIAGQVALMGAFASGDPLPLSASNNPNDWDLAGVQNLAFAISLLFSFIPAGIVYSFFKWKEKDKFFPEDTFDYGGRSKRHDTFWTIWFVIWWIAFATYASTLG